MVGTIICKVGAIIYDIGTINVKFYLLEVWYPHGYYRITHIIDNFSWPSRLSKYQFYCTSPFFYWNDSCYLCNFLAQPSRESKNTHHIRQNSLYNCLDEYFSPTCDNNFYLQPCNLRQILSLISLKALFFALLIMGGSPKYFSNCAIGVVQKKISNPIPNSICSIVTKKYGCLVSINFLTRSSFIFIEYIL